MKTTEKFHPVFGSLKEQVEESPANLILSTLKKEGITHIFGMHGGYTIGFGDELYNHPEIEFVHCQHEEGAAFMADGYAKATGKFGVVLTTAGPGLSNTLTGIISSMTDLTPILHISGAVPQSKTLIGAIQDTATYGLDLTAVFKDTVRFSANVYNKDNFLNAFRMALRHLFKGKPGPVLLNIASDVFSQKIKHNYKYFRHSGGRVFDQQACFYALEELKSAKSALIIAGHGVKKSNAIVQLNTFVNYLKIPVIVTPKGKSVFNNESCLFLGSLGAGSNIRPKEYLKNEKIDTIIAIGTSFNEYSSNAWTDSIQNVRQIIQIDFDPNASGRAFRHTFGVTGDIKATLNYLNRKISKSLNKFRHLDSIERVRRYKDRFSNFAKPDLYNSDSIPIEPPRLIKDIKDSFGDYPVNIYIDNGSVIFWLNHYMELAEGWRYYSSLGFSSMGYAFPATIGGSLARPNRVHIAFAGDGAAIMNGNELKTASEYNAAVFFFVLNDGMLGIVHHSTKYIYNRPNIGTSYKDPIDFVKFAESLGVEGYIIDKPGQINNEFIDKLVKKRKPVLFDCRINPNTVGPYGDRIKQVIM